ncbi:hypothetical protein D3C72_909030 [compost metagenome]
MLGGRGRLISFRILAACVLLCLPGLFAQALGFVEQVALVVVQVAVEVGDDAAAHEPELVAHRAQQRTVVAHQHQRAFELVERHGQGFAGGQVQVVGGLVQQQQVGALPDHHREHEAGLFAAAHGAHGLLDHVAAEVEAAQEAAQGLLAGGFLGIAAQLACHAHHVLQRVVLRAQHVEFLLREVADVQALAFGDLACQRAHFARNGLHQRRLALAVGAQDADALARQHRAAHAAQDGLGRFAFDLVAEARVVDREHRVRDVARLLELEGEVGLGQQRRHFFHALQRLDAALRLLGLAGLGLEAVDELLQVGDLVLLLAEGHLLLLHLQRAHVLELAVVAAVARELGVGDVQGDVGHGVEKLAVVADDDHGAGVLLQPGFEPHQGVQVQVVGRFVEQQQVARAHQRAGQLQAHAPAAREAVDGLVELVRLEAQAQHQRLRARHGVVLAGIGQVGVGVGQLHADVGVVGVLGVGGLDGGQRGAQLGQAGVAADHEVGGRLLGLGHVLRDLGHAPLLGNVEVAAVFVQRAVEQREQRRLAGAVASHQADLFAGVEIDGGAVQQFLGAAAKNDVFESDHE